MAKEATFAHRPASLLRSKRIVEVSVPRNNECAKTLSVCVIMRYCRGMEIKMRRAIPRRNPGVVVRQAILKRQHGKCFYCGVPLGQFLRHLGRVVCATVCWDHLLPYAYSFNSDPDNFVAACRQCNGIKRALVFDSIGKAIEYVQEKRAAKGLPVFELPNHIRPEAGVAKVSQQPLPGAILLEASRRCLNCGGSFVPKRPWSKFCDAACRNRDWISKHPRTRLN